MSSDTLKYPAGTAITFTTGSYSDFCIRGTVITLKDVDLAECARAYSSAMRKKKMEGDPWADNDPQGLVAWLIVNGFEMAAAVQEVHLGDYSFDPEFEVPEL